MGQFILEVKVQLFINRPKSETSVTTGLLGSMSTLQKRLMLVRWSCMSSPIEGITKCGNAKKKMDNDIIELDIPNKSPLRFMFLVINSVGIDIASTPTSL